MNDPTNNNERNEQNIREAMEQGIELNILHRHDMREHEQEIQREIHEDNEFEHENNSSQMQMRYNRLSYWNIMFEGWTLPFLFYLVSSIQLSLYASSC